MISIALIGAALVYTVFHFVEKSLGLSEYFAGLIPAVAVAVITAAAVIVVCLG